MYRYVSLTLLVMARLQCGTRLHRLRSQQTPFTGWDSRARYGPFRGFGRQSLSFYEQVQLCGYSSGRFKIRFVPISLENESDS